MVKSNLVAIDLEATLRAEANASLAARHRRMMEARDRVPASLATRNEVERTRRLLLLPADSAACCRRARLEDTRPLRALLRRVGSFFKDTEAAATQAEVRDFLTEAGRREAVRRPPADVQAPPASTTIPVNIEPEEAARTAIRPAPTSPEPAIPMVWGIESVGRPSIDLEGLRPFPTESALLVAARTHLKARGRHAPRGAAQADWAQLH